jgi:hypothetical protein
MDANGAALESRTMAAMWALVAGHVEGDDRVVVISGFRIERSERRGDEVLIRVRYDVLADFDFAIVRRNTKPEDWTYRLTRTEGGWRIRASDVPQRAHVLPGALAKHLEKLIALPPNPSAPAGSRDQDELYRKHITELRQLADRTQRKGKDG